MAIIATDVPKVLLEGKQFPPVTEQDRLVQYSIYSDLFEGRFDRIFTQMETKLTRAMIDFRGDVQKIYELTAPKFCTLIPKKFGGLIFAIPPVVVHEHSSIKDKDLRNKLRETGLWRMAKLGFLDSWIYGNGILKSYNKKSGVSSTKSDLGALVCPIPAKHWCPVVSKGDQFHVVGHLTGSIYRVGDDPNAEEYEIRIEYDEDGWYTVYTFKCSAPDFLGVVTLNEPVGVPQKKKSPIDGNRIRTLVNFGTSETGVYGISSYEMYYKLIGRLIERMSFVAKILDEHGSPLLTGPKSVLDFDEKTGTYTFNRSAYIGITAQEAQVGVEYVTWDGKLEAAALEMTRLTQLIYQMAETGAPFLDGDTGSSGFAESARALKIRHKSPLASAQEWISDNEVEILKLIENVCSISNIDVDWKELELKWKPSLPEDELEKAQIFATELGAGMSFEDNLMRRYGMSADGANQERIDRLEEDADKQAQSLKIQSQFKPQEESTLQKEKESENKIDRRKAGMRMAGGNPEAQRRSNDQSGHGDKKV